MDDTAPTAQSATKQSEILPLPHTPSPVSGPKELEPVPHSGSVLQSEKVITQTEPEPQVRQELKDAGVKAIPANPKLSDTDKKAGLSLSGEAAPVPTHPSDAVWVSSYQQAKSDIRYYSVFDTVRWNAALVIKDFKRKWLGKGKGL